MKSANILIFAVAALAAPVSIAASLWYDGTLSKEWTETSAWKTGSSTTHGSLPTTSDIVELNSSGISLPNMLRITSGVEAVANKLLLGSDSGTANYATDGRVIGLKIENGGLLHTTYADFSALSLGENAKGRAVLTIESGGVLSNRFVTVGTRGGGVVTNAGGRVVIGTPSGAESAFRLGFTSSATGTVVMTGGTFEHLPGDQAWRNARIDVGSGGFGRFELSGGVISNRMSVGTSRDGTYGAGTGILAMSGGTIDGLLYIGDKDSNAAAGYVGTGIVELAGGTVKSHVYVGQYGNGRLVLDGGTLNVPRNKRYDPFQDWDFYSAGMYVGRYAGSSGVFVFRSGTLTFNDNANLVVGYQGSGFADFAADATIPYLRIGGSSAGGEILLRSGVAVAVPGGMQIGGYPLLEDSGSTVETCIGKGTVVLSNATLKLTAGLPADKTIGQLSIGRYTGSYGVLRGCGAVQGSTLASNNVRIWMDNGQIIADGFGEDAVLDLNTVVSIRNNTADIAADTTNGWYAVNKGAVHYPRVWFDTADKSTVLGGWNEDTVPGFVNSVGVSLVGVNGSARHLRGGFFASDRSDIHADSLTSGQTVVGVWKLGVTSEVTNSTVLGYTSAALDFRYDQSKVKTGETLSLYRWTGSAWTRVATAEADSTYRISVSGLEAPESYDGIYNIGTFALLAKSTVGLTIIVK